MQRPLCLHWPVHRIRKSGYVFYIELENRNFTQPVSDSTAPHQILGSPAAPFINALVTPGNPFAKEVSFATQYHHVLSTSGNPLAPHPSEPNYLWQEAGTNFGRLDDDDPYGNGQSVAKIAAFLAANPTTNPQHLTGLLEEARISWHSYQEDTNLMNTAGGNFNQGGTITNTPETDLDKMTVPLSSFSGTAPTYTNLYNGAHQYNFACKHDGTLFFEDTNGGDDPTTNNKLKKHHLPLQQLQHDLDHNSVARYNLITPNQYNDMHSALNTPFTYHGVTYTGDLSQIAVGDNFLSIIVPKIMASKAYKDNGIIVIWTDETEGTNQNDFTHCLTEIIISPLAKGNAYSNIKDYTHSSDLNTLQRIYQVAANTPTGFLNDTANPALDGTTDLSDLLRAGVIPSRIPTVKVSSGRLEVNVRAQTAIQSIKVTNALKTVISGPIYVAFDDLTPGVTLQNQTGVTANTDPANSPYVLALPAGATLAPGTGISILLQFTDPGAGKIDYTARPITQTAP